MGEVFKLRDLTLDRIVAGKVIAARPAGAGGRRRVPARGARDGAVRGPPDRPHLRIPPGRRAAGRSSWSTWTASSSDGSGRRSSSRQRARVMVEICGAIQHAHALGLQHRDLKPSNIMVDAQLVPRILDFGLSSGRSASRPPEGHAARTSRPEQLDPSRPIDQRTDVYALGVVLYELLCGRPPYAGADRRRADRRRSARVSRGCRSRSTPRVPEPLQAIALEGDGARARRYATSPRADLGGRPAALPRRPPVLARPSLYATTLGTRVAPHLQQIGEWLAPAADPSARGRAAARRLSRRSTRAKTTGSSRAGRCPIRRSRSTSARFCWCAAACSTSPRIAGTTRCTASPARSLVLGLPFIGLNARRAPAVPA